MIGFIKKLLNKKEQPFNIYHPDIQEHIELAFEAGPLLNKTKYYRFKRDIQMPVGRYKWIDARLHEAELRMDLKTLSAYLDSLEKCLNGTKGEIDLSKAAVTIYSMRTRLNLAFDPETIERLACVVYFTENEILDDYDDEIGKKKIEFWRKHNVMSFFLTSPIVELLNLTDTSEESLASYITSSREILKELIYVAPSASPENS